MKKTLTFKCLALGVLVAMLLCSCSGVADYQYAFSYQEPKIESSVKVNDKAATDRMYVDNDNFELHVDEKNATFRIVDKHNPENVWTSAPMEWKVVDGEYVYTYREEKAMSLIRVSYKRQVGLAPEKLSSYNNSVAEGDTVVHQLENGVRFDFEFKRYGFTVPVQVLLHPQGFEISLVNQGIKEATEDYGITSVDIAPYFMTTFDGESNGNGYYVLADGEGALVDWNDISYDQNDYRAFFYGRDNALTNYKQTTLTQDIRLPVFGGQWKQTAQEFKAQPVYDEFGSLIGKVDAATFNYNRLGYTAIITEGASRAAMNTDLVKSYNLNYAEFIYRDIAKVKVEGKEELQDFVERSNTQVPVQTIRYVLMQNEELNYVDMANTYRDYLLKEAGVTKKVQKDSAPMVVELFGGMMKQQFVLGFPVNKVLPLTSYKDAGEIVKLLKKSGVDQLIINYTKWQKDGTGAAIQDSIQAEGELGGDGALKDFIKLCKDEKISVYLDANTNVMAKSAWGYDTNGDSTATVRWDPAIQYYYSANTGLPDMNAPLFLLKPTKLVSTAAKMANSAANYDITGLSSSVLGSELYSDFAKTPYTRDHAEYLWNDALKEMAGAKGKLLLTGGNAYALDEATFISDAPMGNSDFLCMTRSIPFYQIVLHGVVPMSTPAINQSQDVERTFLWAIETGSNLKWTWTAQNQDELVESIFNHMTGSDYEKWAGYAAKQYKAASDLLKKIATYTVESHQIDGDVVTVVWCDGSNRVTVVVDYANGTFTYDGKTHTVPAFNEKGGAA